MHSPSGAAGTTPAVASDVSVKLVASIHAAYEGTTFRPGNFITEWFRKNGTAYLFTFKKNLKVTNIQMAELNALLKVHLRRSDTGERVRDFQAVSIGEFSDSVQGIIESFDHVADKTALATLIDQLYAELLRDIVILDVFFGSCLVFLPPNLQIYLPGVLCAQSGYIDFAGPSLLSRNVTKATKEEFFDALLNRLSQLPNDHRIRFIVYAHEEFSKDDRYLANFLRDGRDDLKLYIDKYYIGSESLVSVLKEMRSDPRFNRIEIPEPGHYHKALTGGVETISNDSLVHSVWLIVDRKPDVFNIRSKGDAQYVLLYEQEYESKSTLHIFDENKPAWIDHTTIPHTLAGAMLNITRPWWPEHPKAVVIGDPFAGTCTTLIEALKFNAQVICRDTEPLGFQLVKDNIDFVSMSERQISDCREALMAATAFDPSLKVVFLDPESDRYGASKGADRFMKEFFWALKLYESACPDQHSRDADVTKEIAQELSGKDFIPRLFFYVMLRTHRRNLAALERDAMDWKKAFQREAQQLIEQIDGMLRLRKQQQLPGAYTKDGLLFFPGRYSLACAPDPLCYSRFTYNELLEIVKSGEEFGDARTLPKGSCDVIVTDPPYGLNAPYDRSELARLLQEIVPVMLEALKPEGQLVFALPDWSHVGGQVPFFMTKPFVTQVVLAAAEKLQLEVLLAAYTVPAPREAFRPPYYWESERALRRAILHFRLRVPQRIADRVGRKG